MKKIKVGIVEDEMIIAETISLALKKLGYLPTKPAYSYESAISMLEEEEPEIVLLDINLNDELDGVDLAHYINANYSIPIIFLTANSDRNTIERSKQTRPNAFLVKPFSNEDLFSSIEIALFNHEMSTEDAKKTKINLQQSALVKYQITSREEEIILLVSQGFRHKEISKQLFISEATVKRHLSNIYQKVGVQSSIDALNKLQEE
jgi:DNA-binding NarL/FixJ family response regulator